MTKLRVHELAKKAGVSSKEMVELLLKAGVEVKTASSSVDAEVAAKFLKQDGAAKPAATSAKTPANPAAEPQTAKQPAAKPAAVKAQPKPAVAPAAKSSTEAPAAVTPLSLIHI